MRDYHGATMCDKPPSETISYAFEKLGPASFCSVGSLTQGTPATPCRVRKKVFTGCARFGNRFAETAVVDYAARMRRNGLRVLGMGALLTGGLAHAQAAETHVDTGDTAW